MNKGWVYTHIQGGGNFISADKIGRTYNKQIYVILVEVL